MFLAAASQRTKNIRLGFGVMHLPPPINHPARIAERVARWITLSNGRVEFGTGEGSSIAELGRVQHRPADKRGMWRRPSRSRSAAWSKIRSAVQGASTSRCRPETSSQAPAKPHPGVGGLHPPSSVNMAAEKAIGALSFAYTGPGPLKDRVDTYYRDFRGGDPGETPAINPNILAIRRRPVDDGGPHRRRDDQASGSAAASSRSASWTASPACIPRAGPRCGAVSGRREDPTLAYGPGRGAIGSPDTVRQFLRDYGVQWGRRDHPAAQPARPRGIVESIEIMGKEILPEFIERDERPLRQRRSGWRPSSRRSRPGAGRRTRRCSTKPMRSAGCRPAAAVSSPHPRSLRHGPRSTRDGSRRPRPRRKREGSA